MNTQLKRILSTMVLASASIAGAQTLAPDSAMSAPPVREERVSDTASSERKDTVAAIPAASPAVGVRDSAMIELPIVASAASGSPSWWRAHLATGWSLLLDFADVDGGKRWNQRHFASRDSSTNLCCVDLAWMPWRPVSGFVLGASLDLGGMRQKLSDGTRVSLSDILVAASLGWSRPGSGPWARGDLGVATLVVDRRSVGTDWGVGGSIRAGWRFDLGSWAVLVGGGRDFRAYTNLHVEDVPALTLFAGAER